MSVILLTGASGNVGRAIQAHFQPQAGQQLYLASRNAVHLLPQQRYFDFEDLAGSRATLAQTDILFLLRPPHLSDTGRYFAPLIAMAQTVGVQHLVFLSVQGAEKTPYIPHAKIEKLIVDSGLAYTFIRPSYFMQNLSTTLVEEIREQQRLFLPAGTAPFLWVDVADVGRAIAAILQAPAAHQQQAYTITGSAYHTFGEVAALLSAALGREIRYLSPSLWRFFWAQYRRGVSVPYIAVMIMLHYLPRWQSRPLLSEDFQRLTGASPSTLPEFIQRELDNWR